MVVGGILAGGIGSRMAKDGLPKQFMEIGGVPIIVRTVKRFLEADAFDRIVISMNSRYLDFARNMLADAGLPLEKIDIINGGDTRFESLLCLCRKACEVGGSDCILVTHDCARPFVSVDILLENLKMLSEYDMVTTSIPTIDTVLVSEDGKLGSFVPDRQTIFCDQGPQTFKSGEFLKLVDSLTEEEHLKYIEAGRLYMEKGFRVGICPGSRMNFKMTTPLDLAVAEALLQENSQL